MERYAWIKARAITGGAQAAELMQMTRSFCVSALCRLQRHRRHARHESHDRARSAASGKLKMTLNWVQVASAKLNLLCRFFN